MSKSNAGRWMAWLLDNSLWLAALGLMISSSGIDGAYLAKIMEPRLWVLGYVLNTVSDVSGLIIMYSFGRLQQERKNSKKWRLSWVLLGAEVVAVGFAWFFSWRQLRIVLPAVEGPFAESVAMIAAAFIPLLLAFIGWAQALQAGRFEAQGAARPAQPEPQPPQLPEHEQHPCPHCDRSFETQQALSAHLRWCKGE